MSGKTEVNLTRRPGDYWGGVLRIEGDDPEMWEVSFSERVDLFLDVDAYDSELHLDLTENPLKRVRIDSDNSFVYLRLGRMKPEVEVLIKGDRTDLELCVPASSGLLLIGEANRYYFKRQGLVQWDEGYATPGYDTLKNRIRVDIFDELSSFRIISDQSI
jgi:hypothetical protein